MISVSQKSDDQRLYIRTRSKDGHENSLNLHMDWLQQPLLNKDTNGNFLEVLELFWASSWEEAMTHHYEKLGFEPYVPMEI